MPGFGKNTGIYIYTVVLPFEFASILIRLVFKNKSIKVAFKDMCSNSGMKVPTYKRYVRSCKVLS